MKMSELVSKIAADAEVATAKKNKDAVFSVNDILPDASGNVEIEITAGGGIEVEKFGAVGDGITDDTEAFRRAIEESPEGTRFLLSKKYLVNNIRSSSGSARKNITFIGQNDAMVKIKPNILSVIDFGTLSGLTYQVKDYLEELQTGILGWQVAQLQAHTGRIFEYIKVPIKTTIPSSLIKGAILRGKTSRLQFEVTNVDLDDPDGVGTARIYFLGATNNEKAKNVLTKAADGTTLVENFEIKPYLKFDTWLLDFGVGAIPSDFINEEEDKTRKITQIPSGKVARVDNVYTHTTATGQVVNIAEVSAFHPSQVSKSWDLPVAPLNANENLKIEEFSLNDMSFGAFNRVENVLIENVHFDGSSYEIGARRMNANDWNIIYTDSVRNLTLRNCSFENSVMAAIHAGGAGNQSSAYSDFPDKVLIDNCTFENNGRNDIEIIYGKNIQVTNCKGDNSLDIEMNGNELVESISVSGCSFREFTPYSPSDISGTCEISVTNSTFNRVSAQVGAHAKLSNCYIHSVGIYNANSTEFTTCAINKIDGMYGKSVPSFHNCQIYGLPTDGAASYNEGDKSVLRLNNSIIDLSFQGDNEHGSWGFDFRDSVVISRTKFSLIAKYFTDEKSVFHNVEFNNVCLEAGASNHDMKFYDCQFLLKDPLVMHEMLAGWGGGKEVGVPAKVYLQNCYFQGSLYTSAAVTMVDCVLDGVSKPTLYASKGISINGLKSSLPHGIDWEYVDTPSAGFKVKFNNVDISKNIGEDLGVSGGPSMSNVEEGSTAFYMDNPAQFAAVMAYQDNQLIVQSPSLGTNSGGSLQDDWNLNIVAGTYRVQSEDFSALLNQPVGVSRFGVLIVSAKGDSVSQQYIPHNNTGIWWRSKFGTTDWTEWTRLVTSNDATAWNEGMLRRSGVIDANWDTLVQMGAYKVFSPVVPNVGLNRPVGAGTFGVLAVLVSEGAVLQIYAPDNATQGIYTRMQYGGGIWTAWNQPSLSKIDSFSADPVSPVIGQMWLRSDL